MSDVHHNAHGGSGLPGLVIGAVMGTAKGVMLAVEQTHLSWEAVTDAAVLAAIGASVGFLVTSGLNWLKKKIKKW